MQFSSHTTLLATEKRNYEDKQELWVRRHDIYVQWEKSKGKKEKNVTTIVDR